MTTLAVMITSALKQRIVKRNCIWVLGLLAAGLTANAQQKLRLKDVAKIDLIVAGPVAYGYEKYELQFKGDKWQAYRTFKKTAFEKGLPEATYLSDVSKTDLKHLLKSVAKESPQPDIKSFHIDKRFLINQIDSVDKQSKWAVEQRLKFVKFLKSDDSLQKALIRCVGLLNSSDYSYRFIDIINKHNDTIKLEANTSKLYYLPWMLNQRANYNPEINVVFNHILNPEITTPPGLNYNALIKCAFMECFHTNRSLIFFFYDAPGIRFNAVREISLLGSFDPQ